MPGRTSLLFESYILRAPIVDAQIERVIGKFIGTDIPGGASEFGVSGDSNGKINATLINAMYELSRTATTCDGNFVCEYVKEDETHCVLYNPRSGEIKALIFDKAGSSRTYVLSSRALNGEALLATLYYYSIEVQKNTECLRCHGEFYEELDAGFPDADKIAQICARLSENLYRRVGNNSIGQSSLPLENLSSNVAGMTINEIKSMAIQDTFVGEMSFFGKAASVRHKKVKTLEQLQATYAKERQLSHEENMLVPMPWTGYALPSQVPLLCEHIHKTANTTAPMCNFLIRGGSGTGKTDMARAIACGLKLPYTFITCSASDEVYNFLGQMLPAVKDTKTGEVVSFPQALENGKLDDFMRENSLPTYLDIELDVGVAYKKLTGQYKADASSDECILLLARRMMELGGKDTPDGQRFEYVETDFIRAIRNGWVVEIQECSVITQPGVLVGLNGLLDQTKQVRLLTGELITRHPDTVVILTTNVSYEGCRRMNQSVLSRMSLILDVDELTAKDLALRAKSKTGFEDDAALSQMAEVVVKVREYCKDKHIEDGVCGLRELISWVQSYQVTDDLLTSAKYTILSHAATDWETRAEIEESCLKPLAA